MSGIEKKTSLFAEHENLKAKIVPFGGWAMPVSYEGVLAEHAAVRNDVGIFDVSHMGEVRVKGPDAQAYLAHLTINDIKKLNIGEGQYSAMLNPDGGMIDDLILYRTGEDEFFVCVNASNVDKDFSWFSKNIGKFNVQVTNESNQWSQIAVQGPKARAAMKKCLDASTHAVIDDLPYMQAKWLQISGNTCLLARTGYTGEMGFEIYVPNAIAPALWSKLINVGGAKPIGLGARDTLRLEACYLLYGNDMNDGVSPLEAGIGWAVRKGDANFIGGNILAQQKASGLKRKLQAFKMVDNAIPRHDMACFFHNEPAGTVTSGSVLPTVGGAGGMAVLSAQMKVGDRFEIDIRGKRKLAEVVKRPLYTARVKEE